MNTAAKNLRLQVDARMTVEIDGKPARLVGQGSNLHLELEQEESFDILFQSGTSYIKPAATILANSGLTLLVSENGRPILKIGHGTSSLFSRLLVGTRHVALENFDAFSTIVRSFLVSRRKNR